MRELAYGRVRYRTAVECHLDRCAMALRTAGGSLCEYGTFSLQMVELRNYYVRRSKDVVWAHHERLPLGFSRWRHLVGGAECRRHSQNRVKNELSYSNVM